MNCLTYHFRTNRFDKRERKQKLQRLPLTRLYKLVTPSTLHAATLLPFILFDRAITFTCHKLIWMFSITSSASFSGFKETLIECIHIVYTIHQSLHLH